MTHAEGDDPTCSVWWASIRDTHTIDDPYLEISEQARAAAFRHAADRDRFVLGRTTARRAVADVLGQPPNTIGFDLHCRRCGGDHGKPIVRRHADLVDVSIAHSGDFVVVAVGVGTRVGADIEQIKHDIAVDLIAPESLNGDELAALAQAPAHDRTRNFLRTWTRKEALVKATGSGLFTDMASIQVTGPADPPGLVSWTDGPHPDDVRLHDLDAPHGYVASVAALTSGAIHFVVTNEPLQR